MLWYWMEPRSDNYDYDEPGDGESALLAKPPGPRELLLGTVLLIGFMFLIPVICWALLLCMIWVDCFAPAFSNAKTEAKKARQLSLVVGFVMVSLATTIALVFLFRIVA